MKIGEYDIRYGSDPFHTPCDVRMKLKVGDQNRAEGQFFYVCPKCGHTFYGIPNFFQVCKLRFIDLEKPLKIILEFDEIILQNQAGRFFAEFLNFKFMNPANLSPSCLLDLGGKYKKPRIS